MAKKKRTYNANLIRVRHCYTIKEIKELFGLKIRTVHDWIKKGLKVVEGSTKPFYIMGEDLKHFLKERAKERKFKLKADEFFCPKCHGARKSLPLMYHLELTGKKLGENSKQVYIKGVCEECGQSLTLFSSYRNVKDLIKRGLPITEQQIALIGNGDSSVNTDIERREKLKKLN